MFITISGPIGVGKSTVTRILSQIMGFTPFFEVVKDHPYLEGLYREPHKYAFKTQVFFLRDRFEKHLYSRNSKMNTVADRSIYEDIIFAEILCNMGYMDKEDFTETYLPHFKILVDMLPPPDLMVCLRASIDTLMFRIASRGREMEKNIDRHYMQLLQDGYDRWIEAYPHKKLILETDSLDLTCDLNTDWTYLVNTIIKSAEGKSFNSDSLQTLKKLMPAH